MQLDRVTELAVIQAYQAGDLPACPAHRFRSCRFQETATGLIYLRCRICDRNRKRKSRRAARGER